MVKDNAKAVSLVTLISVVVVLALTWLERGPATLFGVHIGEGAFYRVIPEIAMVVPASLICLFALGVFAVGAVNFWRDTRGNPSDMVDSAAFWKAVKDAFGLAYM